MSSTSTEIVLSPRVGLMRALAMSIMPIAAKTDNSRAPFQSKCDRMWDQLVREPGNSGMPLVVWVEFDSARSKFDRSLLIETRLEIPDPDGTGRKVRVLARPHILVDGVSGFLPYLKTVMVKTGDGKQVPKYMENSHRCFVLKDPNSPHYRVLPLALGSSGPDGALTRWNKAALTSIANAPEANKENVAEQWPIIEPFVHALHLDHRKHKLYLKFRPTCYTFVDESDPKMGMTYGDTFGRAVMHRGGDTVTDVPPADQKDKRGNPCFGMHVFRIVQFKENAIGVTWVGPADQVNLNRGEMKFEQYKINGFDALGLKMTSPEANPRTVLDYANWYAQGKLDEGNLLYVYALGRGEVFEGQKSFQIRNALSQIGNDAAKHVQSELVEEKEAMVSKYSTAALPSFADVFGDGSSMASVWYRESGDDDVVAKWIGKQIEDTFLWDSWLHTRVRIEVLRMIAAKEGVSPPERPVVEAPKEAPETNVEVAAESAAKDEGVSSATADDTVSDVIVPKKTKKVPAKPRASGADKKKKKDASSEASAV